MKPYAYLLLPLLLSGLLSAQTVDEKIARMLELSGAEAQFVNAIDQMIDMQRGLPAYDELPAAFWDDFQQEVRTEGMRELMPDLVVIYRDLYTEEELDHVINYLEHPLTTSILAKQIEVTNRSMAVGRAWGERVGATVVERLLAATQDQEAPTDSSDHKH